jgi:hypothetical protein
MTDSSQRGSGVRWTNGRSIGPKRWGARSRGGGDCPVPGGNLLLNLLKKVRGTTQGEKPAPLSEAFRREAQEFRSDRPYCCL